MKRSQIAALESRVPMSYASTHILTAMSAANDGSLLCRMPGVVAKATAARARGISKSP